MSRMSNEAHTIYVQRRYDDRERTLTRKHDRFAARLAKGV